MINYEYLHKASIFYKNAGYKRIEAPWLVTQPISDITKPEGCSSYIVKKDTEKASKVFVASGEQSFLYMINKGFLPDGRYQTITPCMRDDAFDSIHTKYFMKLELIDFSTKESLKDVIEPMIYDGFAFFQSLIPDHDRRLEIVGTGKDSADIFLDNIEIGSYGWRECDFCNWIYGTGIAEPRFSSILNKGKNNGLSS